ncbi:MAG: ABC transporter permease [Oscillospiraceae bacterium]|nr:ABC transporter permease [Oscillospiraceae bacterium]
MRNKLRELYQYREMIASLVRKDLKGRYKGSVLGFLWTFINPLLQLLVYTIVFSVILKSGIPNYYLHLFVALVPWIFFASSLGTGSKLILDQKNMIKKIYFPREVLPLAYTVSSFCNMLFSFVIVFIVIAVMGLGVNWLALPWLIPVMLIQFILVLGMNLITSSVTVYVRDMEHIMSVCSMAWMYLSPVVYGINYIPEHMQKLYLLNPMSPILLSYRDILYYQRMPNPLQLRNALLISIIVLCIGFFTFHQLQKRFAEEL